MKCDICGNSASYIKDYNHNYIIKGQKINFISKRRFCSSCHNLMYDSELDNDASLKAIAIFNENYGISKEKIVSLRQKYDLSQELFSKIIGCAKKTLISYEKGTSIPNDCYLIILKSLAAKPETIINLIESNKLDFTPKQYLKISNKLDTYFAKEDFNLNEYNGYAKLNKEKIYNIILYLADNLIMKTKLLKELFYIDFLYYKKSCISITGLEYAKLPYGPVPEDFDLLLESCYENNILSCEYKFNGEYESYTLKPLKKFNDKLFTPEELKVIKEVKSYFKDFNVKEIVDYSHNEQAFKNTKLCNKISFEYAFDINLKKSNNEKIER
jgi:DNA-binding transcriptional regulator YiaG